VLPLDDLTVEGSAEPLALRVALTEALEAQPSLNVVAPAHRRGLAELQPSHTVDGYVATRRFHILLNQEPIQCAGTFSDCMPRIVSAVCGRLGVQPRPLPKPETLLAIAQAHRSPEQAATLLEKAAQADPKFSMVWLNRSAWFTSRGDPANALRILNEAPIGEMSAFDAARIRLQAADMRQDRQARLSALLELARNAPADIQVLGQAAAETLAARRFKESQTVFERLLTLTNDPAVANDAAYAAAYAGDRSAAEGHIATARRLAPKSWQYADSEGEIAYLFGDYAKAAKHFLEAAGLDIRDGIDLWKAAEAHRQASESAPAAAAFERFRSHRAKGEQRNTLFLKAVWDWRNGRSEDAIRGLRDLETSSERSKALFYNALIALSQRDFGFAESYRARMEANTVESVLLRSLISGAPLPPGLQVNPDSLSALHFYLKGDRTRALPLLAKARSTFHPYTEGSWPKLDAVLRNGKPERLLPSSPDDWVAFLLRDAQ
jgi:tetratricopeptide (TPR) repeat protein